MLVGLAIGQIGLELFVVNHPTLLQVDQEHLAGLQAPFAHDLVFRHRQDAGLRCHDDQVIIGDAVARGAQAVAVQCGANLATIGEHDGGRTVPRLQHGGMVFVKGATALIHHGVIFPGLGDHHHHRLADGVARHGQQFQTVVESGGIGLTGKTDRVEFLQIGTQNGGRHHPFSGLHPVVVALDGVDFAVVCHIPVGMGQRPLGKGVGGEALVHQAQGGDAAFVLQIPKIGAHLVRQQQALVDHRATAHTGHVILFAVLEMQVLDSGAGCLADHVQLALQGVLHDDVVATANKDLAQDGLFLAHRG